MVSKGSRHRGPPPRSLNVFLRTARGRAEGAALAALLPLFHNSTSANPSSSLESGEQACDIYEAYLTYYPQSGVRLEELMLLKRCITREEVIELRLCRECKALILSQRSDRRRRICTHCEDLHQQSEQSADMIEKEVLLSKLLASATRIVLKSPKGLE
jgi:hypothetical protein